MSWQRSLWSEATTEPRVVDKCSQGARVWLVGREGVGGWEEVVVLVGIGKVSLSVLANMWSSVIAAIKKYLKLFLVLFFHEYLS